MALLEVHQGAVDPRGYVYKSKSARSSLKPSVTFETFYDILLVALHMSGSSSIVWNNLKGKCELPDCCCTLQDEMVIYIYILKPISLGRYQKCWATKVLQQRHWKC